MSEAQAEIPEKQRAELFQIYTIERQDIGNGQLAVLAIIAAALTYIVASAGFLIGHYTSAGYKDVPSAVLLGSPLVTLALLSSLVVTVSTNAMRVKHLNKLEELLRREVATSICLPSCIKDCGDIWEIRFKPTWLRVYTALSLATYIPIFLLALGYTFAILIPGPWPPYKKVVFAIYCLAILIQAAGVLVASLHKRFKNSFI